MRRLLYIFIPIMLILGSCGLRTDLFHITGSKLQVYSYDPVNSALPIPTNAIVTVAFNKNMDTWSVENAFSIEFIGEIYTADDGSFEWFAGERAFGFHFDPYPPSTDITVRIDSGAKDEEGYYLTEPLEWTFTTSTMEDFTPPNVTFLYPDNSETISPPDGYVEIEFDEPMIKSTVEWGFVLELTDGGGDKRTDKHGKFQWDDDNTRVRYSPDEPLKIGLDYTIWLGFNGVVPTDLAGNPLSAVSNGYPSTWGDCIRIVVDATQVPGDVTDFPVYIDLSEMIGADVNFFSAADTAGKDIIVIDESRKVKLPRELVYIDTGGGGQGELWFKAPKLSSTGDTVFYLLYNSSWVEPNDTAVWSNGYVGVYHLDDSYNYYYYDSSPHSNDGTQYQTSPEIGQMGEARFFNGNNDYIQLPDIIENAGTVSMWIKPMMWDIDRSIFDASVIPSQFFLDIYSETLRFKITDADETVYEVSKDVSGFTNETWNHVAGVWRYKVSMIEVLNTPAAQLYFNGANVIPLSPNIMGTKPSPLIPYIGSPSTSFWGTIDEVHLSNVRRSSGWIAAEYNNQVAPNLGGFFKTIVQE